MIKNILELKKLWAYLFWLWAILILVLSSLPNIPTQKVNIWDEPFRLDYVEHFGIFAIWGGMFVIWKAKEHIFNWKNYFWFIIAMLLFAAIDEIHQNWIEGRTYNPLDLIYNVVGVISAFVIGPYFLRWVYKK
ncbi:MAG: hypothetical protein B7C24_12060 [Bacteroidetes bacterium 4572_77]|nr:MAG: hypothetical protein B7C24_12060 [Bacteroidetes bacterium 4572_77]